MVHDYSFFGSTADFVIKKGTFGIFIGFGHFQTSETSGRNMAVELDSRHPLLPKTGWENEDFTLISREKKMEMFADTSAFNKGKKHEFFFYLNFLKIENLQHKTSFLTCI